MYILLKHNAEPVVLKEDGDDPFRFLTPECGKLSDERLLDNKGPYNYIIEGEGEGTCKYQIVEFNGFVIIPSVNAIIVRV